MNEDALFVRVVDGAERFRATRLTTSVWAETMQHGAPPSALLARALEQCSPTPGTRLARVTMEILGPVPVGEITTFLFGGESATAPLPVNVAALLKVTGPVNVPPAIGIHGGTDPLMPRLACAVVCAAAPSEAISLRLFWTSSSPTVVVMTATTSRAAVATAA